MQERGNKTIMCSVLFLDIVEYSKKSVAGQISLKDRFNDYLSAAIRDVPVADRIILDTGDGAAINFLGDVEDALRAALSLRESLLNEEPGLEHPLLVRMGINLGPVRLVRDINGQPNIVGDGINVAQRVMGFADASQILVSRSYYDAVSRLSPTYAGMFHYQGSRTDKHVREHEIYAIGYPSDRTQTKQAELGASSGHQTPSSYATLRERARLGWNAAAARLDVFAGALLERYRLADSKRRTVYVAAIVAPVLLIGGVVLKFALHNEPALPTDAQVQTGSGPQAASAVASLAPAVVQSEKKGALAKETKPEAKKAVESKPNGKKVNGQAKQPQAQPKQPQPQPQPQAKPKVAEPVKPKAESSGAAQVAESAYVVVSCKEGTQVFVDGSQKGKISDGSLKVAITSTSKHTVIVSHPAGGIYTQSVELAAGKTARLRPNFCD
ncbi:MAG TPA: adenylate/guanylate cyclase domain-containing protein [Gallionella sp.]|nr:adenylate/guanylate cyclase domain-containing protein [Gallionella sp.]